MATISVDISDVQMMALDFTGEDPQKWLQKAIQDRAQIAMEYIARLYRRRARKEGLETPIGIEAIVKDAFERDWLATEIH